MRTVARALAHSLMSGLFATALVFTACGDDDDGGTTDTAQTETAQETSQETVASLKVLEGGSGSVDPGDGEGAFRVAVESVTRP